MTSLPAILDEIAALPRPDDPRCRNLWQPIYPAYQALRAKGYSTEGAIEWMVGRGLIPKGKEGKALKAFLSLGTRRNKRSNRS